MHIFHMLNFYHLPVCMHMYVFMYVHTCWHSYISTYSVHTYVLLNKVNNLQLCNHVTTQQPTYIFYYNILNFYVEYKINNKQCCKYSSCICNVCIWLSKITSLVIVYLCRHAPISLNMTVLNSISIKLKMAFKIYKSSKPTLG